MHSNWHFQETTKGNKYGETKKEEEREKTWSSGQQYIPQFNKHGLSERK
jgi:hypothetical protein